MERDAVLLLLEAWSTINTRLICTIYNKHRNVPGKAAWHQLNQVKLPKPFERINTQQQAK